MNENENDSHHAAPIPKKRGSKHYSSTIVLSTVFVTLCTLAALLLGGAEIWVFENG
ncbi:hypothetical protein SB748_00620 [Rhizobium sp. SIMBA_035]